MALRPIQTGFDRPGPGTFPQLHRGQTQRSPLSDVRFAAAEVPQTARQRADSSVPLHDARIQRLTGPVIRRYKLLSNAMLTPWLAH
jgi:hypothetical protein